MKTITHIPFNFDYNEFSKQAHLSRYADQSTNLSALLDKAVPLVKPKALYRVCYITDRSGTDIFLQGVKFKSAVLSHNLREVERVFPYIATGGNELDHLPISQDDLLAHYWLGTIKQMALAAALEYVRSLLCGKFGINKLSSMNPGSGERELWPIEEQQPLFSLFGDVETLIGVKLTESCLMIPNKSLSGLFFPTETTFESCRLCSRKNCEHRKVPYKKVTSVKYVIKSKEQADEKEKRLSILGRIFYGRSHAVGTAQQRSQHPGGGLYCELIQEDSWGRL